MYDLYYKPNKSDCYIKELNDIEISQIKKHVQGLPFLVDLLMQTEVQKNSLEGQQCTGTIISPFWVATSEACCEDSRMSLDSERTEAHDSFSKRSER